MTLDEVIDGILLREDGYVNHTDDLGGPTMYGITEAVARKAGYRGRMQDLPRGLAATIYKDRYYHRPGFDKVAKISPEVAAELTDTTVNMGQNTAVRFLQLSLNVLNRGGKLFPDLVEDGEIGNGTLGALDAYLKHRKNATVLLKALNCLQGARYIEISRARPANESFTYGWLEHRVYL